MMKKPTPEMKAQLQLIDDQFQEKIAKYNISFKKIMPIIVISIMVDMLGYVMVMPLLPFYAQSFGANEITIGVITALNAITSLVTGPIWGRLSDKYGRKPILIISQAGTLVSFGVLALSNSTTLLMASRILDGIFGGQIPVINAAIADVTAPETRAEKMAVMSVAMTVSTIVGPMVGGYLGGFNLSYPAYAAMAMSVISMVMTLSIFNETMPKERREDINEDLERKNGNGESTKMEFSRLVVLRLAQVFAMTFTFQMIFSSLSLVLDQLYGATSTDIGNIIGAMGVCTFVFGALLMVRIKDRIGERNLLFLGIGLLILAYSYMPLLPTLASFYLFIIAFNAGNNFARPVVRSNLTRAVNEDQQGLISGYSTTVESLARTIAPLISTGWLQIGGIAIGALVINEFQMIAVTGVLSGLLFLALYLMDLKSNEEY